MVATKCKRHVHLALGSMLDIGKEPRCGRVVLKDGSELDLEAFSEVARFKGDGEYVNVYEFEAREGEVYYVRGVVTGRGFVDSYFIVNKDGDFYDVLEANDPWSKYRIWLYLRGEISTLE